MRPVFLVPACALVLGLCAALARQAPQADMVKVRLKLIDTATGHAVGGVVRVFPQAKDRAMALPGLFDRLRGRKSGQDVRGWYVVPAAGAETTLPRAQFRLEAVSGLESALARQEVDLRHKAPVEVGVKLSFLFRPQKEKLAAG